MKGELGMRNAELGKAEADWMTVRLGDVVEMNPREVLALADDETVGFVPMSAVCEVRKAIVAQESRSFLEVKRGYTPMKNGDVIVAKITPCFENGKVAMVDVDHDIVFGSTEFHVLRGKGVVNQRLIYHLLRSNFLNLKGRTQMKGAAGQKRVPSDFFRAFEFRVPRSPSSQQRLAAILDKADALRRKRQEALRLTDDFLRSTFLDMFGDLRTNSKGWQMRPLAEGVAEFEGGRNFNPTDTARSDGFKVLKVSAVTSGEYAANESKHFSESDAVPAHYLVRPNDLLISRANTAELVGAVAYVWKTQGTEVLPDKLWRFVWPEQPTLEPLFMLHLARSPYFRDQLIQRATGSSGSMKNIGKAKMLEIPVPYPPYTLQERFSDIAKQLQKTALQSAQASQESETLFSALQQRAFSGRL